MRLLKILHDGLFGLLKIERRFDPFVRPAFEVVLRDPLTRLVQAIILRRSKTESLQTAEETTLPGEDTCLESIIADMGAYLHDHYPTGKFERAGNTKTHGVVRGDFIVRDDLPAKLRHGVFIEPHTFRAWVRFGGP